jgi:UDP-glucuronate 4-epimerase
VRVFVTGGVGFIGYHVCRALLDRGDSVTVLDDFSDAPYPTREKRRNARDLLGVAGGRLVIHEGCVTDAALVKDLLGRTDGVVHLAGLAGVRPSFAAPARYARVNVEGTATVVELSRQAGLTRVVFASSSSVYGNSTPLPAHEEAPAVVPESPYAASKRGAELVAAAIGLAAPTMACAALRFFTVYGPRQRPEMAITLFTRKVLAGEPITVFGDGSMRRDFTHVDDIVRGVVDSLDHAPAGFRAYNLGSGAPVDLQTLVQAIADAAGRTPVLERAPRPLGDVDATYADVSRAKNDFGWAPSIPLREGLRTVVDWVKANP